MSDVSEDMKIVAGAIGRPPPADGNWNMFHCPRWLESRGTCCPAGTVRKGCPGLMILREKEETR